MWRKRISFCLFAMILCQTMGVTAKEMPPQTSLQAKIDQAKEHARIEIGPGVYKERLVIDKPIQLIAQGAVIDGGGKGHVVEIRADRVRMEGFTIRNSGRTIQDAGIHILGNECEVIRNQLIQVKLGLFLDKASRTTIMGNRVEGHSGPMAQRGNGIHLLQAADNLIVQNTFYQVQDGIYLEHANRNTARQNTVKASRYAFHLMGSVHNRLEENRLINNVNGFMIMTANDNLIKGNDIREHLAYRGYGILAYQSDRLQLTGNRILNNHTGIMLEETHQLQLSENLLAGNSVGLELNQKNQGNQYFHNHFIGNVVQAKLPDKEQQTLVTGEKSGNYWDDYQGLDLNEDRIGDVPYEAGTMFDRMVAEKPLLQLFFESPAVRMLSATEKLVPSTQSGKIKDDFPLLAPLQLAMPLTAHESGQQAPGKWKYLITGTLLLGMSLLLLRLGRRETT